MPCDTAKFAKSEAQFFPNRNGNGKFIQASGETDGIRKFQAEQFDRQIRCGENFPCHIAGELVATGVREKFERKIMDAFRVLREEDWPNNFFVNETHFFDSRATISFIAATSNLSLSRHEFCLRKIKSVGAR